MIGIISILHFFTDMICAYSIFSHHVDLMEAGQVYIVYNFCAFALQMPIGALVDLINLNLGKKRREVLFACTLSGIILTCLGAITYVWLLGLGNALFHVGGGIFAIDEDNRRGLEGRGLGVFVAPGAIGLFLGTRLSGGTSGLVIPGIIMFMIVLMIILRAIMWRKDLKVLGTRSSAAFYMVDYQERLEEAEERKERKLWLVVACAFLCVVLRSYVGMSAGFIWKDTALKGFISVLCIAGGKTAGGFLAANFGSRRATAFSLASAALCFLLSRWMVFGLMALFLFNMTMPITLYSLVKRIPRMPGLAFGILTFGLFMGFVPWLAESFHGLPTEALGALGSLVSLLILYPSLPRIDEW